MATYNFDLREEEFVTSQFYTLGCPELFIRAIWTKPLIGARRPAHVRSIASARWP